MSNTNKNIFKNASSYSINLSEEGKKYLTHIVQEYTNIDINTVNLNNLYNLNNPDFDGDFMNEISSSFTKDGQPFTFTLDIETDFDFSDVEFEEEE